MKNITDLWILDTQKGYNKNIRFLIGNNLLREWRNKNDK